MSASRILLGVREGQEWLSNTIKSESNDIKSRIALAGDDTDRVQALNDRKAELKEAMRLLGSSVNVWDQARQSVPTRGRGNENEALRLGVQSLVLFLDACDAYDPDLELPASAQSLIKQALPDDGAKTNTGDNPVPVQAPQPAPPAPADDDKAKKTPEPAPAPVKDDKSKTDGSGTDLLDAVKAALKENSDTVAKHVEECATQLTEFRKVLDELRDRTINPELAVILNTFSEDELRLALTGNGGGNVDTGEIKRQLEELAGKINTDDLKFLRDLRVAMDNEGLTIADLIMGARMGRGSARIVKFVDAHRWNRSGSDDGSTDTPRKTPSSS